MLLISCGSEAIASQRLARNPEKHSTSGLEQLYDGPNSDVLEGGVRAGQEAEQVLMHSTVRLVPHIVKSGIVIGSRPAICEMRLKMTSL